MTTHRFSTRMRVKVGAVATALLIAAPAGAQLTNASASDLAMAGNTTAFVRGFGAISVNPAGLGMSDSGFSLAVAPVQTRMGLAPITWGDIVDFQGQIVPAATREEWLTRVVESGGQGGSFGADLSAFALTLGNVGFQLSTTASANLNLPEGVVEAALFGNAGRSGSATDLSLVGASMESYAMTTAAMSFALPINEMVVFGLTGKYTYGHGLAVGHSVSGDIEANPVRATMDFPLITSCQDEIGCTQDFVEGGSGFGMDLGAMVDLGGITLGGSIQNIISSFAWDETKLGYRPGTVMVEVGQFETDYDELPFDQAPDDLQAMISDFTLKPSIRLGAAMDVTPALTVTGDIHGNLADQGIALQPDYTTGVGAELRMGFVQLRAGLTKISEGMQYGGGASLVMGPVNVSGAAGVIKSGMSDTAMFQLGLSFGHR